MQSSQSCRSAQSPRAVLKVLVCFAVREEAQFFAAPPHPVTDVLITGIGVRNASQALSDYLSSHQPRLVLTCGFAGGLNPTHRLGQVLFDATNGVEFEEKVASSGALAGRFAHSERVVVTAGEKARLFGATGADAVEMESSAIVTACRERKIPVIVIRGISDTAMEDLPMDFNRFSRPDGSLSIPRLLLGVAKSPGAIRGLVRFRSRLNQASKNLGATLERFLVSNNLF